MPEPHSTIAVPPEETASASSQTPPDRSSEAERVRGTSSGRNWSIGDGAAAVARDETCSCFAVVFSFWLFGNGIFNLSVLSVIVVFNALAV